MRMDGSDHSHVQCVCPLSGDTEIWAKNCGKPTALDLLARDELISPIKSDQYQKLLKDKKTTRKSVFKDTPKE